MRRTTTPPPLDPPYPRAFVGWVPYLETTAERAGVDSQPGPAWTSPEEAEKALTAEYGQVPMAEFFDFGSSEPLDEPSDGEDGPSVLRVLR